MTGQKVSCCAVGRLCQASPNRVEVIWPCTLMVVIDLYIPVLKGVARECVSLNSGCSVAPVSILSQRRQEFGGFKWDSHGIIIKTQCPFVS